MPKPKPSYSTIATIRFPFVPRREVDEIYALLKQLAENEDPKSEVEISDSSSIYESISELADRTWKPESLELSLTGPRGLFLSHVTVSISPEAALIHAGSADAHRAAAAEIYKIIKRRTPGDFVLGLRLIAPTLVAILVLVGTLASAFYRLLDLPGWLVGAVGGLLSWSLFTVFAPFGKLRLFKSGAWLRPLVDEQQGWIRIRERMFVSLVSGAVGFGLGWLVRTLTSE